MGFRRMGKRPSYGVDVKTDKGWTTRGLGTDSVEEAKLIASDLEDLQAQKGKGQPVDPKAFHPTAVEIVKSLERPSPKTSFSLELPDEDLDAMARASGTRIKEQTKPEGVERLREDVETLCVSKLRYLKKHVQKLEFENCGLNRIVQDLRQQLDIQRTHTSRRMDTTLELAFAEYCQTDRYRHLNPKTRGEITASFMSFMSSAGRARLLGDLTDSEIRRWARSLAEKMQPPTVAKHKRYCGVVLRYASARHGLPERPLRELGGGKRGEGVSAHNEIVGRKGTKGGDAEKD